MDAIVSSDVVEPPSPDWAFLPEEILNLILNQLIQLSDYVRFGAVCKSWQAVGLLQKVKRRCEIHKQVPMLLVRAPAKKNHRRSLYSIGTQNTVLDFQAEVLYSRRSLYSITQNKVLDFQVEFPYSQRCRGCSFGWLTTVEKDTSIKLVNPFSGGKTIRLPPVVQSCDADDNEYEYRVHKVVLSSNPSLTPDDFVALALYGGCNNLAYIKPGQACWTYIDKFGKLFLDAIYHRGKFYAVAHNCGVIAFDPSCGSTGTEPPQVTEVLPRTEDGDEYGDMVYIMESASGEDLLLVQRFIDENSNDYPNDAMTAEFKIFKLLGVDGCEKCLLQRVEINSLGGDALFLGNNDSLCVSASNFPGCQPNCIYYTDDYIDKEFEKPFGPLDTGIYSLEDKSIRKHYRLKARHTRRRALHGLPLLIWIVPTLS
ncbi:hypothetical protein Vadar_022284 [Vaccinium darrowii]|uniref:Uncharacterized protein n=1 Tax=Vaccinium darrowii TaxID=229202 RepID=A0ACB7ZLT2_9ERIC|nr:hypothetical protein Vadar_022284 [Vaccinium darrowii]